METVGITEARMRFSQLIANINATGQQIAITKRGKVVACLSPAPIPPNHAGSFEDAIDRWRKTRKGISLGGLRVRDLINEGRR